MPISSSSFILTVFCVYFQHNDNGKSCAADFLFTTLFATVCIVYGTHEHGQRHTVHCVYFIVCVWLYFFVCLECYGLLFEIFFTLGVLGRCVNRNHFLTEHSTPYTKFNAFGESKNTILRISSWEYCMYNIRSPPHPPITSVYSQHTFFLWFGSYLLVSSFGSACIYDTFETPFSFLNIS